MLKKTFKAITLFTGLAIFNQALATNSDKYPEFSWDTMPLYMHVWKQTSYSKDELNYLAQFPLITLEKAQGKKEGSVQEGTLKAARAIKQINPKSKILYYKNIVIDWHSGASKDLARIPNGYLQTDDGDYPVVNDNSNTRFFDISKGEVQQWWLKDAKEMLTDESIDGLFIDANIKVLIGYYFAKSKKLGQAKADALIAGYHDLLSAINNEFRDDNIILGNIIRARFDNAGLEYMEYFDGSYFEGFEHNVGGVSKPDYLVKGIEAGQKAAREGKILAFTAGLGEALKQDSSKIGLDEARQKVGNIQHIQKRLDYLTAIFLVMAEKYSYFYPHDGFGVQTNKHGEQRNRTWMQTFPAFKNRLGAPKGPAKRDGYIFTREFAYCSVYLNVQTQEARLTWK
ncbi:putative glycoside hydrolase [Aliiglaciecola lipolytica]|uniref:putative glycoside hydrolase n=1 Tax=Aliiglaciecola lipolytica TaxID=477689 RepID=UPI001C08A596|nr:putative glycoside hydrolase [Aliiglaciecola lipolytica]MBU2877934.1 putative glycoside hydrolase family 15 protein [Aliiglaciecola lipolytica]